MWQLWTALAVVGVLLVGFGAVRLRRAGRTLDSLLDDAGSARQSSPRITHSKKRDGHATPGPRRVG